ncbi:MAG TPA: class I SAM-dependent methyltransferase [Abditibacteriaceae bacterium]|jgi:SAM-dependent methyltransferase
MAELPEAIYQRPDDYDLEHVGDTDDIEFFVSLLKRLQPKRVLELACGNGRVTLPLAQAGAKQGFEVAGLEMVPEMLEAARQKLQESAPDIKVPLMEGDMREWKAESPFDVILTPCSSVCHLLTLEDQLATWRCAYQNLKPGGRFVVDVTMADQATYADSFRNPAREIMEIDLDTFDEETNTRLIRYKTTRYLADQQRARIRFLYDKFVETHQPERSISDFESHVYYPREMHLLFLHSGFEVEEVYGDYQGRPLKPTSSQMIFCGRKPE